jgi:protein involved in plasmid replication-relaxation
LTQERMFAIQQQLSPSAHAIISTLATVRVATGKQIERLHFNNGTNISRVRMRNIALRRLTDLGVLARWRKPNGGHGGGSDSYCYALDRAGQMVAMPDKPNYWREPYPSAPFLAHRLAVTELYVLCHEIAARGLTLRAFDPEPLCWRQLSGYSRRTIRPDARLVLYDGHYKYYWFIEVDMGTERLERIKDKLKLYSLYRASGKEQAKRKVFPGVLFLVLDQERKQRIEALIRRQSSYAQQIFWVELQQDAYTVLTDTKRFETI